MGCLLDGIDTPDDLKRLDIDKLAELADELRVAIRSYVGEQGGHLASNLGVVELTIALHYVFDTPHDQLVLDVSHQCYAHKMLTGRSDSFIESDRMGYASGFTNPHESQFDLFAVGHASTSISLATGLAYARDLKGHSQDVIALVGDGALSGGEAFEGLNNAAHLNSGIIIVVNDNECSIAPNVGGLYDNLADLRQSNGSCEHNIFRDLGFAYTYIDQGNDIRALIEALSKVRHTHVPTVVHVHTTKGKGDSWAEANPERAHELHTASTSTREDLTYANMANELVAITRKHPDVVVVSPATPLSHGLTPKLRHSLGAQFVDVGIAEGHALTFAAALAKEGARPVVCISSTFLQRAYDQLIEDVALGGLPVTVLCYKAGLAHRDATHVGSLDIALTSPIANLTCLAPRGIAECAEMLTWAIEESAGPAFIRVPRLPSLTMPERSFSHADIGHWQMVRKGRRVAFITLGDVLNEVWDQAVPLLEAKANISPSIIIPTTYSILDEELLLGLEKDHDLIVSVEDGVVEGGFGQRLASFFCNRAMRVLIRGGAREFTQRVPISDQYLRYRLTGASLVHDVLEELGLNTA